MAIFCLCSMRKKNPTKMELSQNLRQMKDFTNAVYLIFNKQTSYQKWSCHKFYGKHKIFVMAVYLIFNEQTSYQKWSCHKIYGKLLLM